AFSSSSRALFSSARHCLSVASRLSLSPIFAAARQLDSTSRAGTLSATVNSNVPASARSDADGNMRVSSLLARRLRNRNCAPRAKRRRRAAPASRQRGIARWQRASLHQIRASRSAVASPRKLCALGDSWPDPWPNALRGMLSYRGRRRRTELAAVEHGVIALVAFLEAYRGGEHVGSALGLLELMHPPIRDL